MNGRSFVDTNILVYDQDAAFPAKQARARELLTQLWKDRTGRVSIQVCNEYFVTMTRKLKPGLDNETAWNRVEDLAAWEPVPLDYKTLTKARETQQRYGISWWDSLIVAAAFLSECALIYSEDLSHGQEYFGIRVINPFLETP